MPRTWKHLKGVVCTCAHCGAEFDGSFKQKTRVKYEKTRVYCSPFCRRTAQSEMKKKPIPWRGPCPTCGEMFQSRRKAIFCKMDCYTKSKKFADHMRANRALSKVVFYKNRKKYVEENTTECLNCGVEFYRRPSMKGKYCSQICYRRYMAGRFDRWIADPQTIALPQGYDGFLTQEELPCLVDGCVWRGAALSGHMNFAHGVQAEDFKRAAGFNLKTGVVSAPMHEALSDRPHIGVAVFPVPLPRPTKKVRNYTSLEGREHAKKGRALLLGHSEPPTRKCMNCGKTFKQSTPFGYTKYCTVDCRTVFGIKKAAAKEKQVECSACSVEFKGTRDQARRQKRGLPIACSLFCRQQMNSKASAA